MAFASNPRRILTSIKTGVEAYGLFIQLRLSNIEDLLNDILCLVLSV
jgi:hypothetical protein